MRIAARALKVAVLPVVVPWMLAVALGARADAGRRRREGQRPRLVYGPAPIISIKYMSLAMRQAGYETLTFVQDLYPIHVRSDFDRHADEFFGGGLWGRLWRVLVGEYAIFAWLVPRYDVFHFFFDGGFLRRTPLRFWEVRLLHLAGKRVVALPYGSDVAVPSRIHSPEWRHGLMLNYPDLGRDERPRRRWIRHFSRHADFVVACLVHFETLPRWDLLTIHYYPIDTEHWASERADPGHDGRDGPVTVVHAPNHRAMKGTAELIRACESLQAEGLQVTLRLLEHMPNAQVRDEIAAADIVAEQFLLGYGLNAMEGMSMGKPVLSNLSSDHYYALFRRATRLATCPIVSATPESLPDDLRRLVTQPGLRRRLGAEGRRYMLAEHSYAAMAELWDAIYRRVWHGEAVDPSDLLAANLSA